MRFILASAALLMMTGASLASGGLGCDSEDGPAKVSIQSGITRGLGSPLFQFQATFETSDAGVAEDLRKTSFEGAHVPQYWLDQTSLNLLLYRERGADAKHGYVEILVQTQPRDNEEGVYGGIYEATVFDDDGTPEGKTIKLTGTMTCFVE